MLKMGNRLSLGASYKTKVLSLCINAPKMQFKIRFFDILSKWRVVVIPWIGSRPPWRQNKVFHKWGKYTHLQSKTQWMIKLCHLKYQSRTVNSCFVFALLGELIWSVTILSTNRVNIQSRGFHTSRIRVHKSFTIIWRFNIPQWLFNWIFI